MTHSNANRLAHTGETRAVQYGDISTLKHAARAFLDSRGDTLSMHHKPDETLVRQARLRAMAITRGEYHTAPLSTPSPTPPTSPADAAISAK